MYDDRGITREIISEHQNPITDFKIIRETTDMQIPPGNSTVGHMGQDIRVGSVEFPLMVTSLKQRSVSVWEGTILAVSIPNQDASIIIIKIRTEIKIKIQNRKPTNIDWKQNQNHFLSASNHSFPYLNLRYIPSNPVMTPLSP